MTTIGDLMTRDPITVAPNDMVQKAAQLMDDLNVGALPVVRGWQVLGMVTDRDITVRATAAGMDPAATEVEVVMSGRVRCCTVKQSVAEVLHQMGSVQIRRMPVLDDEGRLIGIVALGDLAARRPEGVGDALSRISTPCEPDRVAAVA